MPLYSDSNYYYSGGSSQLYSPYYSSSLYSTPTVSTSSVGSGYAPYTSTYNRSLSGTYVIPPPRSPTYTSPHVLSSRYQPKLSTITETLPLMGSARHSSLMPLTRTHSPKFSSYSSSSTSSTSTYVPKYIPARPIAMNTADIDVSSTSRFRKRLQKQEEEARVKTYSKKAETEQTTATTSPSSSVRRPEAGTPSTSEASKTDRSEKSPDRKGARSTIKRNRAVVRLSTIRSRSKDRTSKSSSNEDAPSSHDPTVQTFKDLPQLAAAPEEKFSWRQRLAEDLADMPQYPLKKTPGDKIRERFFIQEDADESARGDATRLPLHPSEQPIEDMYIELDPLHHTIRRLSIPQCPTFHEICEDISSDKIDDDLNAGELRRRASLIQEKEQELFNQLQNSGSGTLQVIHLERKDSRGSLTRDDTTRNSVKKSKSKRGSKKIRHKISATVEIENAKLTPIIQETDEDVLVSPHLSPKPKMTYNVEAVEEHHEIPKIFKLPKRKSVKKTAKSTNEKLPEGFVKAVPKMKSPPKAKPTLKQEHFISTAEIFTFDEDNLKKSIEEDMEEKHTKMEQNTEFKAASEELRKPSETTSAKIQSTQPTAKTETNLISPKTPKSVKPLEAMKIPMSPKAPISVQPILEDQETTNENNQITEDVSKKHLFSKAPVHPGDKTKKAKTPANANVKPSNSDVFPATEKMTSQLEKSQSLDVSSVQNTTVSTESLTPPSTKIKTKATIKSSTSLDHKTIPTAEKPTNLLEKSQSLNVFEMMKPAPLSAAEGDESTRSKTNKTELLTSSKVEVGATVASEEVTPKKSTSAAIDTSLGSRTFSPTKKQSKVSEGQSPTAVPKPIKKCVEKSDSGEDFWSQIGSRETIYMTNRKKVILENQWKKRENLLEAQTNEEITNLEQMKSVMTTQKERALKEANDEMNMDGKHNTRSNSSSLKEKTTPKLSKPKKEGAGNDEETKAQEKQPKKKISPTKKVGTTAADNSVKPAGPSKINSPKKDQEKRQSVEVITAKVATESEQTTTSLIGKTTTATFTSTTASASSEQSVTTTTTTTTNKINAGQAAKSPEEQLNEFAKASAAPVAPTKPTTAATAVAPTIINNSATTTAETTTKEPKKVAVNEEAKSATDRKIVLPTLSAATAETTTPSCGQQETKVTKLSEALQKPSPQKTELTPAAATQTTAAGEESKVPAKTATVAIKTTPTIQTSPSGTATTAINADHFIPPIAVPKVASPISTTKAAKNASSVTKTITTVVPTTHQLKPTMPTTTPAASTPATAMTPATATTPAATINPTETAVARPAQDSGDDSDTRGGINLSKYPTVSNLAQCLQDVDADLEDYVPSSAENSDDDSSSNYSSLDGCENLSESMKKKVKQRRKKEKAAEKARFDPQKKIKIDTTNKCYVKDEAPRYPLVATPRPLWKREKIIYPPDSEDESDSDDEEEGSDGETEDSEECSTTSEEYEDDFNASAVTSSAGTDDGGAPKDPNSSIIRMSTCSNDSGFEGGTAPSSPKKMLECDVNCHKKCERLTANLCGVNQKLIVEALACVRRGAQEARDSPSTPPSTNPAYKIDTSEEHEETSYTYAQFQKSGRFTAPATIIPRFKTYSVEDFHFLAVLGKGSFGKVLLAELRNTEYYYAVKCLKKDVVLEDDDVDSTLIERKVLALGTKHPYLCHLFCTFQTESHLFFVMEYLNGGDLMFHIQESGRFSEERARFYGAEIISGLKFLHKKGIIYRDLKLDNVLLDFDGHVRIADFGMCKLQIYLDKTADSFCGTPDYMAPEIIKGEKYNQNVDWWSFGVLLYEMLIGQSPFSGCDEDELFWSICNEIPWFPVYISGEATSILKGLLEKDYTKRIGSQYSPAGDIADHTFFCPIDWNLLDKRQLTPPFKPQVKHPLDTQYFDRVFTRERVRLTPIDKEILQSMDQKQFHGFSYTNPHITLD